MLDAGAMPFAAALGFAPAADVAHGPRCSSVTLRGSAAPVALIVASWGEAVDALWRDSVTQAMLRGASCCLLFNGTHVRFLDAGRTFTRRYLEFDIDQIIDDPRSFQAFWMVIKSRDWRGLVSASDRHAADVCRSLRSGVLSASTDVLSALIESRANPISNLNDAFEQALTIVYRIVFLLFAEARALVPVWHPTYRESYSLEALRAAVELPQGAVGLWDGLRAIARLAHTGCRAGDLRVTPFNGRLFAPARTPLAERRNLDDEPARRAMLALSTRPSVGGRGRQRIAYRDLGVEQLGAVYETLLDYEPHRVPVAAPGRARVELRPGSGLRKATGTFYTPQPIAEFVVRRALAPLVCDAEPDQILRLRVVDPSMGSGAFLVAACRYLSAAYESALVRSGGCYSGDIGDPERAAIRRTIAERCLYGVDLNPMAVQLARLSLWLATLAGGRPLSFLDHRLHTGNSLIGAWITSLSRSPVRGARPRFSNLHDGLLFDGLYVRDGLRTILPSRFSLESIPNDTIEQVRAKENTYAALNARGSVLREWRRIADVWCASWLDERSVPPAAFRALADAIQRGSSALPASSINRYLGEAASLSRAHRFFHWELECPEVFFAADGTRLANPGFDAVLGNPPWDMLRAGDDLSRRLVRFSRDAGIYTAQSDGHANCYQLFLERALALTRTGGRVGLVLPAGLATDSGNTRLRRYLTTRSDVDMLVGFENQRRIFPIHRSIRFLLLTTTVGRPTRSIACRVGISDPDALDSVGDEPAATLPWFTVRLPAALLETLSGDSLAIPWLPRPIDLAIAERAASLFRPLGSNDGWRVQFGRELNATEDRDAFRRPGQGLPVVEGKQISPFAVDLPSGRWSIRRRDAIARLPDGRYQRRRLAYRDVAAASNQLTLIAAILPADCVSTHTVFCLRTAIGRADEQLLCGLFNSYVLNYLVRLRVSTHVTTAVVEQLPVPTRDLAPQAAREIAALSARLAVKHDSTLHARLQARVAALYQLSAEEFEYVLSTFPLVPQAQRDAALVEFTRRAGI
jgi:hypothetical protein